MGINVPRFLSRFLLSYHREDTCIEYFIKNADSSETLSKETKHHANVQKPYYVIRS